MYVSLLYQKESIDNWLYECIKSYETSLFHHELTKIKLQNESESQINLKNLN